MLENLTQARFRVGYLLAPKKVHEFFQDSLIAHASNRGVDLVPIDPDKPLLDQGPFDCVVHKHYDEEWHRQLNQLVVRNPGVVVIDPLEAIERLHNRASMLEVVNELKIGEGTGTVEIPVQVFAKDASEPLLDVAKSGGLKFPVIAKPLIANGSMKSHEMRLVFNEEGLGSLEPPIVLQEFVNHGGVMFKVYVAGGHVRCDKRRSLPDFPEEKTSEYGDLLPFSQISNSNTYKASDESIAKVIEEVEMVPTDFVNGVAKQLRDALKLHLFNFDMIRDSRDGDRYLVIDINYFPGYAKLPDYEEFVTGFFLDLMKNRKREGIEEEA